MLEIIISGHSIYVPFRYFEKNIQVEIVFDEAYHEK